MSESSQRTETSAQELELHRRLVEGDRVASAELAITYLEPLIEWLQQRFRSADAHHCVEAAEDSILSLIRNPKSYDPGKMPLEGYLRMSARRDLSNVRRKERRHHKNRESWNVVELPQKAGNYTVMDDPVSGAASDFDEQASKCNAIVERVAEKLTESDRRILELMRCGERRTAVYAKACGVAHLPPEEQKREVKKAKDRVRVRVKRAGERDERTS